MINSEIKIKNSIRDVLNSYSLGEIIGEPVYEKDGLVNYNFWVKMESGDYMVRASSEKWQIIQKDIEHSVTDYLNESGFNYKVPIFINGNNGEKVIQKGSFFYDVYERLSGKTGNKNKTNKGIVEMVGEYHELMRKYPERPETWEHDPTYDRNDKFKNKLLLIKDRVDSSKNVLDITMGKYIDLAIEINQYIKNNIKLIKPSLYTHGDINFGNILFENGTPTGLIDFGNIRWGTKGRDLVFLVQDGSPANIDQLVQRYRKHARLSDKEASNILPECMIEKLKAFRWIYAKMDKSPEKKGQMIKELGEDLKKLFYNYKSSKSFI